MEYESFLNEIPLGLTQYMKLNEAKAMECKYELLTVPEFAKLKCCSVGPVYEAIRKHHLKTVLVPCGQPPNGKTNIKHIIMNARAKRWQLYESKNYSKSILQKIADGL